MTTSRVPQKPLDYHDLATRAILIAKSNTPDIPIIA
jgi:hypothetical protein